MTVHKPVTLAQFPRPRAQPDHARKLINAAFCGKLEPQDMVNMARALLQISDEIAEFLPFSSFDSRMSILRLASAFRASSRSLNTIVPAAIF